MRKTPFRCPWCLGDDLYVRYHDEEWGTPVRDDTVLFEFLILEGMQAGLSWYTILKKRDNFRRAFAGFDPARVAAFGADDAARLMQDAGIVRNRAKIAAAITNAGLFLDVAARPGGFSAYLWDFVDGKPVRNAFKSLDEVPASTPLSDRIAKDLRKRGFKFVGSTIIYAFMQAVGLVNDHLVECFRYREPR